MLHNRTLIHTYKIKHTHTYTYILCVTNATENLIMFLRIKSYHSKLTTFHAQDIFQRETFSILTMQQRMDVQNYLGSPKISFFIFFLSNNQKETYKRKSRKILSTTNCWMKNSISSEISLALMNSFVKREQKDE